MRERQSRAKTAYCAAGRRYIFTVVPPSDLILSISCFLPSRSAISSLPPMLLPLTMMFGTVRWPVISDSRPCSATPSGCVSSSTTYGAGSIVYLSSSSALARFEYGQYVLEKMTTVSLLVLSLPRPAPKVRLH